MFIDARSLLPNQVIDADICIIGAGAAGLALAREFKTQPYHVCLLESGGFTLDRATQSLYSGQNKGLSYYPLNEARARYFGGTTNLWGGTTRPLDDIDFTERSWVPYSGWPIAKNDLQPYYDLARQFLDPVNLSCNSDWTAAWEPSQTSRRCKQAGELITYLFQLVAFDRLRLGERYRAELEAEPNINLYFHASTVAIETNKIATTVNRICAASSPDQQFWINAKLFILATGGIENPRLLLASNQTQTCGLGNQHDQVGKCFMEHPFINAGKILCSSPQTALPFQDKFQTAHGTRCFATLSLSEPVQQREQLLNSFVKFVPVSDPWSEAYTRLRHRLHGTKASVFSPVPPEAFPSIQAGPVLSAKQYQSASVAQDLRTLCTHFDRLLGRTIFKASQSTSSLSPGWFDVLVVTEQAPHPSSCITLSPERDRLGLNQVELHWNLSSLEHHTLQRSLQIVITGLQNAGLLQTTNLTPAELLMHQPVQGSYHHLGTTRMSLNPRQGVVDTNCLVHGLSNLYIAGSSVFPTGGISNPTLTLVALAIRLADHLKMRLATETVVLHHDPVPTAV
jgi:choline dehydrogenase-like flavoprotein